MNIKENTLLKIDINRYLEEGLQNPEVFQFGYKSIDEIMTLENATFCNLIKFVLQNHIVKVYNFDYKNTSNELDWVSVTSLNTLSDFSEDSWSIPPEYLSELTSKDKLKLILTN